MKLSNVADGVLRSYQWRLQANRTCDFAHKVVAVMNDKLVLRPSPAKTADFAYEAEIGGLIDGNTNASIGSSHQVRPGDAKHSGNRQTKLAPIIVIGALRHETDDDGLVPQIARINCAKSDVGMTKPTRLRCVPEIPDKTIECRQPPQRCGAGVWFRKCHPHLQL